MDLIIIAIVLGLLAVVYGFSLIVLALIMALVYNKICCSHEAQAAAKAQGEEA